MATFKHYGKTADPEVVALREARDRLNEEAAEKFSTDPQWRAERAQEMTEALYEGFEHENLISLFTEVESLPFTGRSFVKETRGLKAFWLARGGYIEASHLHSEVMEIERDIVGFRVNEFEEKLETNFAETAATMVELGIQRMDAEVNRRFLALIQEAIPSGHASYEDGPGLDLTEVNTAIREIKDTTRSGVVSIIGRSTMTEQIVDALSGNSNNYPAFLPETNEEMLRRGVLGTYRGARIITVQNFLDGDDQPFFPNNELFVLGNDAMKFAFWGGLRAREFTEGDNWYWSYAAKREVGGVLHRPDRIRRLVDTSL